MGADTASWVGQVLSSGRYRITAKLGEGGMGLVFRAFDKNVEVDVVIKIPRQALIEDPAFSGRFSREVRSLARFNHPHIVKVLDFGDHRGSPFAVLQYLPGGSLRDRQGNGPQGTPLLAPPQSLNAWLPDLANALDFIHQQNFIHRDVKPENILFDAGNRAYLSDFGIVKALYDDRPKDKRTVLTGTGMVLGTPQYMAPEVLLDKPCDGRVDQYALAATVYEFLSGRVPFDGRTPAAIILQQTTKPIPPLSKIVPSVSGELAGVVHKALEPDPERRFQSCHAFATAALTALSAPGVGILIQSSTQHAAGANVVSCPSCKKRIRISANVGGKTVRCPSCEKLIVIDDNWQTSLRGLTGKTANAAAPLATPSEGTQAAPRSSQGQPYGKKRKPLLVAVCVSALLGAGFVSGYFLIRGPAPNPTIALGPKPMPPADPPTPFSAPPPSPTLDPQTPTPVAALSVPAPLPVPGSTIPVPSPTTKPPPEPSTSDANNTELILGRFAVVDLHALKTPSEEEYSLERLATYLTQPAKNDTEKARAIFRWIADRISFDDSLFDSKRKPDLINYKGDNRPEGVLHYRKCICTGFANLFDALCKQSNVESAIISGHLHAPGLFIGGHVWNAVRLDNNWYLVDCTGSVSGATELDKKGFNDFFFLAPPEKLVFTHFPHDTKWQLLSPAASKSEFDKYATLVPRCLVWQYGVGSSVLKGKANEPGFRDFVEVFDTSRKLILHEVPLDRYLPNGSRIRIRIESAEWAGIVVQQDDEYHRLAGAGPVYEEEIIVRKGKDARLRVWGQKDSQGGWKILEYTVE